MSLISIKFSSDCGGKLNNTSIELALEKLGYDFSIFDLDDFVDYVAGDVRREIIVRPRVLEKRVTGIWVKADTAHYVFYNSTLHRIHQIHSILHELAHIVLRHPPKPLDEIFSKDLLKDYDLIPFVGMARSIDILQHNDPHEVEAETFVYTIQGQLTAADRLKILTGQATSIEGFKVFADIVGYADRKRS